MNGKHWDDLFGQFAKKSQAKRRNEDEERARIAWYDEQTKLVMALITELVRERSESFEHLSGLRVEVKSPSRAPINVSPEGPFMSFIAVALGMREVHMYSHRLGANPPSIHYAITGDTSSKSRKRLQARAGCRIEQREGGGFRLRDLTHAVSEQAADMSVDDVAFRGFELLLQEP